MKTLVKVIALAVISSMFTSCGLPMAAMRSVQSVAGTAMSVAKAAY
jgi:hypothetical protein